MRKLRLTGNLDAQNLPEIIFMFVIAMPLNGAWFALVGLGCWYLRNGLARLKSGPTPLPEKFESVVSQQLSIGFGTRWRHKRLQ